MINSIQLANCLATPIAENFSCQGVSIDSRTIKPGELYIAIIGDQFDGHDYVEHAFARGAVAAVVSKDLSEQEKPLIRVGDTVIALGQIAAFHRRQFHLPIIALTGSCGKTSVKEMIATILGQSANVLATPGNFNNQIGAPLSLLQLKASHQYAVFELGANHQGEIAYTAGLVAADVVLVNNVSAAHLEGFGSIDGVAKAKGEIYASLSPEGLAIVNADEPYLKSWLPILDNKHSLSFSLQSSADVFASDIGYDDQCCASFNLHILGECQTIQLKIPGKHNVANALAAATACRGVGITIEQIKSGLEQSGGVPGRLAIKKGFAGARIIDDSYNANYASVKAAIEVLAAYPGQRIFVLGDLAELGGESEQQHRELGLLANDNGIDMMLTCGHLSRLSSDAFLGESYHFDKQSDLVAHLKPHLAQQSTVVIKGSRSSHMEQVVNGLSQ